VVLLGAPDAESTQTLAQTVVAGVPPSAGLLAGVPLGLMSLDRAAISGRLPSRPGTHPTRASTSCDGRRRPRRPG